MLVHATYLWVSEIASVNAEQGYGKDVLFLIPHHLLTCDTTFTWVLVVNLLLSIFFCRMLSVFNVTDFTDNDFVNIYPIGRDFVAASESDVIHSFDPETLETKDRVRLTGNR